MITNFKLNDMKFNYYSEKEIKILKKYYPDKGYKFCIEKIKQECGIERPKRGIILKANKLGLYVKVNNGWIKKGSVSHNKGKKISPETYEKIKHTFFKKGNKPHNTKKKHFLSKRRDKCNKPYWYIRIEENDWRLLHREIYKNYHNCELKSNQCVVFVDGNTDNIHPDNFILLNRNEQINRNNPRMHYPKEVVDVIILNNKLKRKIKSNAKKQNKRPK